MHVPKLASSYPHEYDLLYSLVVDVKVLTIVNIDRTCDAETDLGERPGEVPAP